MPIKINPTCVQCHLKRNMEIAQSLGDDATAMAFLRELLLVYANAPDDATSPLLAPQANKLLDKHYHLTEDRYMEEKKISNQFVIERMEQIQHMVAKAEDPVFAAIQMSILGNYLDFAALQGKVRFEQLEQMLSDALNIQLDMACYRQLQQDLAQAKKLLYITDNAGEIGFDRVLAEQIHAKYPQIDITFCVRGMNVYNDATRVDAKAVGISFPIIDNGNDVPGTALPLRTDEVRRAMEESDVILSKGMGNTETLYGCGYNIYYAFLIKCEHMADFFSKPLMTPMLVHEKQ